jgi:class 3 adenylate cyclase
VQEIADWLGKLGMSEYADRFAENKIDVSVLRHLTDQDLKDIGVALGHRRKILAAIAETSAAPASVPAPASQPPAASPDPLTAETVAERRQVTVMFSDLVGSTALSARMDPEDLREVISAYQQCVAESVQRFGGFVAKYMGDGVLVYFGYPQAIGHPFFTPVYDFCSPSLVFGRVALVGDAASTPRPHIGFGVSKAAAEAQALTDALSNHDDIDRALAAYNAARQPLG